MQEVKSELERLRELRNGEINKKSLEKLRSIASVFDKEERKVVLEFVPVNELLEAAQAKCATIAAKLESIKAITEQ